MRRNDASSSEEEGMGVIKLRAVRNMVSCESDLDHATSACESLSSFWSREGLLLTTGTGTWTMPSKWTWKEDY